MRWAILSLMLLTASLSGCNKPGKNANNDDAYGEYEIADPQNSKHGTVHVVEIVQMQFVPDVLHVSKGDTVVWVNKDIVKHDVTELSTNSWSSSPLAGGVSWKTTFTNSQLYQCSLHLVMRGKIIVDGQDIAMTSGSSEITMCDTP